MTGRLFVVSRSVSFDEGVGGLERAVTDQIRGLSRLGWDIVLVAPARFTIGRPFVRLIDVPWPRFSRAPGAPGFGIAYYVWIRRVRRLLRQQMRETDSLYVHGAGAGVLRGLSGYASAVANPHGMEEFRPGGPLRWTNRVFTRHLARAASRADAVLATDDALVGDVRSNLRVRPERVLVIPNGVDVDRLDRLAEQPVAVGADVISVGRLVHNKGYDLLLDALKQVVTRQPDPIVWRHFGDGPERDHLQMAARDVQGLKLTVLGGASDVMVQSELAAARVFVQPSRYEGSSLTTLEAMTQGCIAVGTPVGGIPEKLTDGVTGFLAADVSAEALARAIERALVQGPEMGVAARNRVKEKYDIAPIAAAISEALERVRATRVVQVARRIGPGSGVAQVVFSLESAFVSRGLTVDRVTLENTGLRNPVNISKSYLLKIKLLIEVVWFSIAGSVLVRRIKLADPRALVIVHGDPIGGDIYVNHGLMKEVVRRRRGNRRFYIPANPMHWITLFRDEIRYRSRAQKNIVCLTESDAQTARKLYPKIKSPITVIPNGVDMRSFYPDDVSRRATRAALGLQEDDYVLIFVGHEFERKGLSIVLDAMSALPANVKLLIVGGARDMVADVERESESRGLVGRIQALGQRSDTAELYRAADLFVLLSAYETGPLVLLEALASGTPVVVTAVGIAPQVVESGVNGRIVGRDAQSLVNAVVDGIADPAMRKPDVGDACVVSARPFSWDEVAPRYLALLQSASPQ